MPQTTVLLNAVASFPGVLGDIGLDQQKASYFSQEAALQVQFGTAVMQGAQDQGANILTAGNVLNIIGVAVYSASFQRGIELGTVADANGKLGLLPNTQFNVLKRGRIWVLCEEAVTPASLVRVRCTNAGNGAGTFRTTSAGGGLSMVLTGARYLDTAGIGGLSRVEFDVLQRRTWTAD